MEKKTDLVARKKQMETELKQLQAEEEKLLSERHQSEEQTRRLEEASTLLSMPDEELLDEMYAFIDKVIVSSDREIEIRWKLDDCFQSGKGRMKDCYGIPICVALYMRVATEEQTDLALDHQEMMLKTYAREHGYCVMESIREISKGAKL